MYTERTSGKTPYRITNANDLITQSLLKTPRKNFKVQKTLSSLDNSAANGIQTTRFTENDDFEQHFDQLLNTSPTPRLVLPINQSIKDEFNKEFRGDYCSNPIKQKRESKRSMSNAHIDSITAKNDRNFQHYINYLDSRETSIDEACEFRRKLLKKGESHRKEEEIKALQTEEKLDDTRPFYSPLFMKAMELSAQKTSSIQSTPREKKKTQTRILSLRLPLLSKEPAKSISLTQRTPLYRSRQPSQLDTKGIKILESQFRLLVDDVLVNYDEFLRWSSKHYQSYIFVKDYLLSKPGFGEIFYSQYNDQFIDLVQAKKILSEQLTAIHSVNKSASAIKTRTISKDPISSKDPAALPRAISEITPKLDKTLLLQMDLFNQELLRLNVERQLREIKIMSDTMINNYSGYKAKYAKLIQKLYYNNRKNFHKLKNTIETIERDYPIYPKGIMTRIHECEKGCGEMAQIKARNRAVASCLDNVLLKWSKTVLNHGDAEKHQI